MTMKQCTECGLWFDAEVFFRRTNTAYASAVCGTLPICIACEQTQRDEQKIRDRWPTKIRDTIRRHAARLKITAESLQQDYGWQFERMLKDAKHAYADECGYCHKLYVLEGLDQMGHGLADLSLDILDPTKPPYYDTNTKWACQTCNRGKSQTPPHLWGAKLACWNKWHRGPRAPMQPSLLDFFEEFAAL